MGPPASYPWAVNDRFLRSLRREPVDRTPVWFMRQAGRYLPEYRALRGNRDILETCRRPDLAAEITLQPLRRMPLDAAIIFSDIMVPLAAVGVPVRIEPGTGPVVDEPIRSRGDLARLRPLEPEGDEPYLLETVRLLRKELEVPLIGFADRLEDVPVAAELPVFGQVPARLAHEPDRGAVHGFAPERSQESVVHGPRIRTGSVGDGRPQGDRRGGIRARRAGRHERSALLGRRTY